MIKLRYTLRNGIICETETTECKYSNSFYPNDIHVVYVPEGLKHPAGVGVVAGDRITLMFQPESPPVGARLIMVLTWWMWLWMKLINMNHKHEKEYEEIITAFNR